jgi:hypothetical protein
MKARSKLPKKRRRVLPVEQPRRKRDNDGPPNRRMNMPPKPHHPANALFRDAFGSARIGILFVEICCEFNMSLI